METGDSDIDYIQLFSTITMYYWSSCWILCRSKTAKLLSTYAIIVPIEAAWFDDDTDDESVIWCLLFLKLILKNEQHFFYKNDIFL